MQDAPIRIPVYYDFASSLCYVAHRVLERMSADLTALGVELVWRPLDLTLLTGWRRGDPIQGARRQNALRVARELEVQLHMPATWPDSRPALAISLALAGAPREATWRERVWTAAFEERRSLEDAELERLGRDLGLDATALANPRRLDELETRTRLAADEGVTGVPTFMLDTWPLGGIQDEQTMRALLGRFVERRRRLAATG